MTALRIAVPLALLALSQHVNAGTLYKLDTGTCSTGKYCAVNSAAGSAGTYLKLGVASSAAPINCTVSSNTANYNIFTSCAGSPATAKSVTVTINAGVYVYSTSTSVPALDTGTGWPAGSTITVVNSGYIVGKGGDGGNAGTGVYPITDNASSGAPGGPAFRAQYAITVSNQGVIGGGGGGGGGGNVMYGFDEMPWGFGGSGGGGGAGFGAGGTAGTHIDGPGTPGAAGALTTGGTGGLGPASNYCTPYETDCGYGGNGGSLGAAGTAGDVGAIYDAYTHYNAKPGGAAGAAVVGNLNITWTATGTRYGVLQ